MFRLGVAISDSPAGPFTAEPEPIKDRDEPHDPSDNGPAIGPRVARLSDDMLSFAEPVREIRILDENGAPILQQDRDRRFFEATWMHKHNGKYYFSYSTGIRTGLSMRLVTIPTGRSRTRALCSHRCSAGPHITPFWNSRESGGCSTTTLPCQGDEHTCGA